MHSKTGLCVGNRASMVNIMGGRIIFQGLQVQSTLTKLSRKAPYGWDLNISRLSALLPPASSYMQPMREKLK